MKHGLRVVFRTDASEAIGIGHFMRCLTLANTLQKNRANIRFVCRKLPEYLQDMLARNKHELVLFNHSADMSQIDELPHAHFLEVSQQQDAIETLNAISDGSWDWIIVDHYALDARYETVLRSSAANIMVIDDIADRVHDCDLLLDQNLYSDMDSRYVGKVPDHCRLLLGPGYALLRDEFRELRQKINPRNGQVRRILVFLGGFDPYNITGSVIRALGRLDVDHLYVDVVIGEEHPYRGEVEDFCQSQMYHCHIQTTRMAELLAAADLAIGAGGSASWERCCLGVPTVTIAFADNQRAVAKALSEAGASLFLGNQEKATQQNIMNVLGTIFANPEMLSKMSSQARSLVDGEGCIRVTELIMEAENTKLRVRFVGEGDEMLLLEWANDPDTRQNAFSQEIISTATHNNWFRKRLRDRERCRFYIVESSAGIAIGQVRFEREDNFWEVHYSVAPLHRAQGFGRPLLGAALEKFGDDITSDTVILGQVKNDNFPSMRIFKSLGFKSRFKPGEKIVVYQRSIRKDDEDIGT